MATPALQTVAGPEFGDGKFQPDDMVTVHGVSNLDDGLTAKIIGYDPAAALYVVKDAGANVWGIKPDKLRPLETLTLTDEWQAVPEGVDVPGGVEVKMDLSTGKRLARLAQRTT